MNTNNNITTKKLVPIKKINKVKTYKSITPSKNKAIKRIYIRDYYGKKTLPTTNIIQYINNSYNDYMIMKTQKDALDLPPFSFEDFFIVNDALTKKEDSANIDIQINKNPNASLNKLLAYSLYYSEYKNWFNSPNKNMDLSSLKFQSGKDFSRMDFTINDKKYKSNNGDDNNEADDNSLKTDKFNVELMNILSTFSVINFDLLNKIDIAMCQNMINFFTDLTTLLIIKKITPEKFILTKAEKSISINLTKSQQSIFYNFKANFWITKDGGIYNPEFTCAELDLIFLIDFKRNTYKFPKFKLKYNSAICYQDEEYQPNVNNVSNVNNENNQNNEGSNSSSYLKYIPAALGVGGIIATPFLLGALGGKNKKIKQNKTRKQRNKKSKRRNKNTFYK
jgi:hypothetical protein